MKNESSNQVSTTSFDTADFTLNQRLVTFRNNQGQTTIINIET